jgi:hypothetical protein
MTIDHRGSGLSGGTPTDRPCPRHAVGRPILLLEPSRSDETTAAAIRALLADQARKHWSWSPPMMPR